MSRTYSNPLTFESATRTLGKRSTRKLANNTYLVRRGDDCIALRLHRTDIATFYPDRVTLSSGGWRTVTTKERLNRFTHARIGQERGIWYHADGSLFVDGAAIDPQTGVPLNPVKPDTTEKDARALKRQIADYVRGFCDEIKAGRLEYPGNGDCWGCLFKDKDTGAEAMGTDHLRLHMTSKERYYVPSLLFNAIRAKGYRDPALIFQIIKEQGARGELYRGTQRILRDYLTKRLMPDVLRSKDDAERTRERAAQSATACAHESVLTADGNGSFCRFCGETQS